LYEHAYSVPNAVTILPLDHYRRLVGYLHRRADGLERGLGNEWFVREEMKFYAPVPVSVEEMDDNRAMIIEDLVGKQLKTPTLFEQAGVSRLSL